MSGKALSQTYSRPEFRFAPKPCLAAQPARGHPARAGQDRAAALLPRGDFAPYTSSALTRFT